MSTQSFPTGVRDIVAGFAARTFSAEEYARFVLGEIERRDPELHAFLEVFDDVVQQAREKDAERAAGSAAPLLGIPVATKDNLLIRGRRAGAGSKILEGYVAAYDATAIARLGQAGAVFLGRTNMDEFAMGSSTEHSAFGPTKNPHDPTRVPGGSSGGSAAAVAAGFAPAALGSDTGGSIRQPAAFSGVVGFKPTYGTVSRSGLVVMASSLDQIGPFARSVDDARLLFNVIAGRDPLDATSAAAPSATAAAKKPLVIGVPKEYFGDGLDPAVARSVRQALAAWERAGARLEEISLPHARFGLAAYYIIMPAEVSSNLARFDGIRYGYRAPDAENLLSTYEQTRAQGFGAEPKRRIMLGTFALSHGYYDAYYEKAQRVRRLIRDDFAAAFRSVDVIAGPTAPMPAFRIGERTSDPLQMYLADIYTVGVNLAGLPAISLPAAPVSVDGASLPVGLQLIGQWGRDHALLDAAADAEAAMPDGRRAITA
ncbi:Asp-tRNA(Asn)/Glu-tRNA(Gln) amidotransferase subunit GatA [Candidatus Parcubacteria bacterium]|nr:MAG: Asp-tRNA(Asn)/Glu-tRNA(Gln) amidotransferase subunit GatA [Candidatus Parcubacteria bacterium]